MESPSRRKANPNHRPPKQRAEPAWGRATPMGSLKASALNTTRTTIARSAVTLKPTIRLTAGRGPVWGGDG